MKSWLLILLGSLLLLAMPFRKYDTESLLPIVCIQAQRRNGQVYVLSEAGRGVGDTWTEAVEDLRSNALGEVFFDTAEQAVFSDMGLAMEAVESGFLRPSAEVFLATGFRDPEELSAYLKQHGQGKKVGDLQTPGGAYGTS